MTTEVPPPLQDSPPSKAVLTLSALKTEAGEYLESLTTTGIASLYAVTDGKAVGTFVEANFTTWLTTKYAFTTGNAASGIDFPDLGVDLKVTSVKQPQSSCPFRDARQKVYGLGYDLLLFVYEKEDDHERREAHLRIHHGIFIDKTVTGDFQTTSGILKLLDNDANADDIMAFLEERNLPLDEIGRSLLTEEILKNRPTQGYVTLSNALQWRLQYGRAIDAATKSIVGIEAVFHA